LGKKTNLRTQAPARRESAHPPCVPAALAATGPAAANPAQPPVGVGTQGRGAPRDWRAGTCQPGQLPGQLHCAYPAAIGCSAAWLLAAPLPPGCVAHPPTSLTNPSRRSLFAGSQHSCVLPSRNGQRARPLPPPGSGRCHGARYVRPWPCFHRHSPWS
jgi:hypothetical protein